MKEITIQELDNEVSIMNQNSGVVDYSSRDSQRSEVKVRVDKISSG